MGWKSTRDISRQEAMHHAANLLSDCSDEALADVLERLIDDLEDGGKSEDIPPRLHGANFRIRQEVAKDAVQMLRDRWWE